MLVLVVFKNINKIIIFLTYCAITLHNVFKNDEYN